MRGECHVQDLLRRCAIFVLMTEACAEWNSTAAQVNFSWVGRVNSMHYASGMWIHSLEVERMSLDR